MHSAQVMQRIVDAVPHRTGVLLRLLDTAARFAAPVLVGDDQRLLIQHRGLDARPGAHIDAHLLAHEAAQQEGGGGQHADRGIGHARRLAAPEFAGQGRRVGEIHDPRAAGPEADDQVDRPLDPPLEDLFRPPGRGIEPHLGVAVAIDQPIDVLEQVGPDGLRAGIAAPGPPDRAGDHEQADARHDQHPGHEVEFVRPDLDPEHIEPAVGHIDQHRLVRCIGTAIPADPRGDVIDPQGQDHHQPFEAAEAAVHRFRKDGLTLLVQTCASGLGIRVEHFQYHSQEDSSQLP
ncbi:MAG: hypothetical protein RL702_336 [Pseudomonadota bacterium]